MSRFKQIARPGWRHWKELPAWQKPTLNFLRNVAHWEKLVQFWLGRYCIMEFTVNCFGLKIAWRMRDVAEAVKLGSRVGMLCRSFWHAIKYKLNGVEMKRKLLFNGLKRIDKSKWTARMFLKKVCGLVNCVLPEPTEVTQINFRISTLVQNSKGKYWGWKGVPWRPKSMVFEPFWSEIGYGMCTLFLNRVCFRRTYLVFLIRPSTSCSVQFWSVQIYI